MVGPFAYLTFRSRIYTLSGGPRNGRSSVPPGSGFTREVHMRPGMRRTLALAVVACTAAFAAAACGGGAPKTPSSSQSQSQSQSPANATANAAPAPANLKRAETAVADMAP